MDCAIRVAKPKKLICGFVFAYAISRFSHDEAQILSSEKCKFLTSIKIAVLVYLVLRAGVGSDCFSS